MTNEQVIELQKIYYESLRVKLEKLDDKIDTIKSDLIIILLCILLVAVYYLCHIIF
jgi:hypothetical protein